MDEHTKEVIVNAQASHDSLATDGGWTSRKFFGFILVAVFIVLGGILGCFNKFANFDLSTIVDGLIVSYSVFCGVNIASKFNAASVIKSVVGSATAVSQEQPTQGPSMEQRPGGDVPKSL